MTRLIRRAPILAGLAAVALVAGCAQPGPSAPPPAAQSGWPAADVPISDMDKATIQAALNKLGYDAGPVDGFVGRNTRVAIRAYQADIGAPANGYYSPMLVERLKTEAGPVAIEGKPEAMQPAVAARPAPKKAAPKPAAPKPAVAAKPKPAPQPVAAKPASTPAAAPAAAAAPAEEKKKPAWGATPVKPVKVDGGDGGGGGW